MSQVFSELISKKKLTLVNKVPALVTYEDPCHLGRGMGIYEDPRIVLRAIPGVKLVEMYPTKHAAWCCGSCGGVPVSDPDLALKLGQRKLALVKNTGADMIATSCPEVKIHLDTVIEKSNETLVVKDLAELVAESMGV
jgi:heterodisulfide reductase subunit D